MKILGGNGRLSTIKWSLVETAVSSFTNAESLPSNTARAYTSNAAKLEKGAVVALLVDNNTATANNPTPADEASPAATVSGGARPLKKAAVTHMAKPAVIKTGDQPLNNIPLTQIQAPEGMETAVITYDYDPLYRLTEAAYTGAITATYRYDYDAVGNM